MARLRESPAAFQDRIKKLISSMYTQDTTDGIGRNIRKGVMAAAGLSDPNRLNVVGPLLDALEGLSRFQQGLAELAATDIEIKRR